MRNAGNGQSLQCLRKKKTNGRHASKNASQLETMIATELAKSFSSGMEEVVRQAPALRKRFFVGAGEVCGPAGCAAVLIGLLFSSRKIGGVLASTRSLKRRRHVEDGSLASLKSGPKKINADHQDLALAA